MSPSRFFADVGMTLCPPQHVDYPDDVAQILEEGPAEKRFAGYERFAIGYRAKSRLPVKKRDIVIEVHKDGQQTEVWPACEVWNDVTSEGKRYLFIARRKSDKKITMPAAKFKRFATPRGLTRTTVTSQRRILPGIAARIIEEWPG